MLIQVSVKSLAEFVYRRGDLYPALGGRVTGEEGIATQKRMQRNRGGDYQCERTVSGTFEFDGLVLDVSGRVDGCDLSVPLVEEITRQFSGIRKRAASFGVSPTTWVRSVRLISPRMGT